MKTTSVLALSALSLVLCAAVRAQDIKFNMPADASSSSGQGAAPASAASAPSAAPSEAPASAASAGQGAAAAPAPAASFTGTQLSEEVGWAAAKQSGMADLGFTPEEAQAFLKGFATAMNGGPSPYDLKSVVQQMNTFMSRKQAGYAARTKRDNLAEADAFFAKVKQDKGVVVLPSGLCYKIIAQGDGPFPSGNDVVKVNYTGYFIDGTVFDTSARHGKSMEIGLDQVIPGWNEGIQKINRGGKIRLFIPSSLGYGDQVPPGIQPGATLVFDIQLVDFHPAASSGAAPSSSSTP